MTSVLFKIIFLFSILLVYAGCSGGVSANDGAGGGAETLGDVTLLEDIWVAGVCGPRAGGGSAKSYFTVVETTEGTISFSQDVIGYGSADCTGAGVPAGAYVPSGSIVFSSTAVDGAGKYFRGVWTPPSSPQTKVIWALKNANMLCITTDTTPTSFPTARDITNYINLMPAQVCYTRESR